ncbi:PLP-dependent aminotransferase family protein [Spirochaeta cellobiosiphila]|uniref:aminotransferase-like domain-containing protein n=1 Tax=Spirochaeta cellobiosiphila TaxID=504483 RepID=UPI0004921CEF|nr:PLP-dependent aminotransferase family protein [Spirochaeta cellobiosiphila]
MVNSNQYLYEDIADDINNSIDKEIISRGSKLPSLRILSQKYNCSISVIMQAYSILEGQGKIYSIEKSGYYVSHQINIPLPTNEREGFTLSSKEAIPLSILGRVVEASNDHSIIPLGAGVPDTTYLPLNAIKSRINKLLTNDPSSLVDYTHAQGDLDLRISVAELMSFRGVEVNPSEITITNGCIEALSMAIQSCSHPGDIIAIESPVFLGTIQLLKELKRRIISIPTSSENGIDLEILSNVLKEEDVKAFIVTSLYQNPLGYVMPEKNREKIVKLGMEHKVYIIEDDVYNDCGFYNKNELPIKSYDKEGEVLYCSSLSKTISPGSRIGWILGGRLHKKCRDLKFATTLGTNGLIQKAIAQYLNTKQYHKQLAHLQKTMCYQSKQMTSLILLHFPHNIRISQPKGGYYLWVELSNEIDSLEIFEEALEHGISVVPGQAFSAENKYSNFLRISFASPINESIEKAIITLGSIVKQKYR